MPTIKVKSGSTVETINVYPNLLDVNDLGFKVVVAGKNYYAGLTSNLSDANVSKMRIKSGTATYGVLFSSVHQQRTLVLTDTKYKMSDLYPNDYKTMTAIPDILDTSQLTTMEDMFRDCYALTTIPTGLDTSHVTNMVGAFFGCSVITTIPKMDTSKVKNFSYTFNARDLLTIPWTLDFSGINWTSWSSNAVFNNMFILGSRSYTQDVSGVPAAQQTAVAAYFKTNFGITLNFVAAAPKQTLVLTDAKYKMSDLYPDTYTTMTEVPDNLDTSQLTTMEMMFYNCLALTSIPEMDTSNVTSMKTTFGNCPEITTVPAMDTSKVTDMSAIFAECRSLVSVPALNTSNVTNTMGMFQKCVALKVIPFMDTRNVSLASQMFFGCSGIESLPALDFSNLTNILNMFYNCSALKAIPAIPSKMITSADYAFENCVSIKTIPALDLSNVSTTIGLCGGCSSLTTIPKLNLSKVSSTKEMFYNCSSLPSVFPWTIDMSSFTRFSSLTTRSMFTGSSVDKITVKVAATMDRTKVTPTILGKNTLIIEFEEPGIVLTDAKYKMSDLYPTTYQTMTTVPDKLDTSQLTTMREMFYGCNALTAAPEMNTSKVTNMSSMFIGCLALTTVPEMDTSKVTDMSQMFYNCKVLPAAFPWTIKLDSLTTYDYRATLNSSAVRRWRNDDMFVLSSVKSVTFNMERGIKERDTASSTFVYASNISGITVKIAS